MSLKIDIIRSLRTTKSIAFLLLFLSPGFLFGSNLTSTSRVQTYTQNELLSKKTTKSKNLKKKEKDKDENKRRLRNPELTEKFSKTITKHSLFEHVLINMIYGVVSGGAIGAIGGFSLYNSNDLTTSNANLQLFALGGLGVGGAVGVTIAIFERLDGTQFTLGPKIFNNSWYGTLGGMMVGAITGSIIYMGSENTDHILNGLGYGALGGFVAGSLMQIIWPKNENFHISFLPGPQNSFVRLSWKI